MNTYNHKSNYTNLEIVWYEYVYEYLYLGILEIIHIYEYLYLFICTLIWVIIIICVTYLYKSMIFSFL